MHVHSHCISVPELLLLFISITPLPFYCTYLYSAPFGRIFQKMRLDNSSMGSADHKFQNIHAHLSHKSHTYYYTHTLISQKPYTSKAPHCDVFHILEHSRNSGASLSWLLLRQYLSTCQKLCMGLYSQITHKHCSKFSAALLSIRMSQNSCIVSPSVGMNWWKG